MPTQTNHSRLFTIALREVLNMYSSEIAKSATDLVDQSKIFGKDGLTSTQLNHLKNLAFRSEVVEDITWFINQQIAKQDGDKGWNKMGFGDSIKSYLTGPESMVAIVSSSIKDKLQAENAEINQLELNCKAGIEVGRRYIGHLVAYANYKSNEQSQDADQKVNKEN